jgi:hypothetical protein
MSAPPIGSTNRTPKSAAVPSIAARIQKSTETIAHAPSATVSAKSAAFTNCWPVYVIGRPLISSCNFPNAISEPANDTEPMSADSTVAMPRSTPTSP